MTDLDHPTRAALAAERDFLLASIDDLERERQAGDLDEDGYASLRADYVARAAATIRAIEALGEEGHDGVERGAVGTVPGWRRFRRYLGRRRVRRVLGAVFACCLLAVLGLTGLHLAGVRLPGQSATGSVTLSEQAAIYQQLEEAAAEADEGQVAQAALLYEAVLGKVPDEPVALTALGWLTRLSGLSQRSAAAVREGDADLAKATVAEPGYAEAEGLYGLALEVDDHDPSAAVAHFDRMLTDGPSKGLLATVAPSARSAYGALHEAVPAGLRSS